MHPLVRGAAAAAVLSALGNLAPPSPPPPRAVAPPESVRGVDGLPAPCGPGSLPEGPVCVRIPEAKPILVEDDDAAPAPQHRSLSASLDTIPRWPERPEETLKYVFPIGTADRPPRLLEGSGAEGALVSAPQRMDKRGMQLAARPGEQVKSVALEGQEGSAEVVYTGELVGLSVVTEHHVMRGKERGTLVLIHGRLDRIDPAVATGVKVRAGDTLGYARSEAGGHLIEVYFEARVLREGASIDALLAPGDGGAPDGKRLFDQAATIPIDARNVLLLR